MLVFETVAKALREGIDHVLVTVIRAQGSTPQKAGRHMVVFEDRSIVGTIGGGTIEHRVIDEAIKALSEDKARLYSAHLTRDLGMCCGGTMEVFLEPMRSAPKLVIFGAGHVSEALCPMAVASGFEVTIVDERDDWATDARFPTAHAVRSEDPIDALASLPNGPNAHLIIVTHSHRLDEDLLRKLAGGNHAYLGMIGSKAKVVKFTDRLTARGVSSNDLADIHMPIGLSIGAVSPAEIAVSIVAQLVQVRRLGQTSAAAPMTLKRSNSPAKMAT